MGNSQIKSKPMSKEDLAKVFELVAKKIKRNSVIEAIPENE